MLLRSLFLAGLFHAAISGIQAGEIIMLKAFEETSSANLVLAEGESAKLAGVSHRGSSTNPASLRVTIEGVVCTIELFNGADSNDLTIPGPATIQFRRGNSGGAASFATMDVTRAPELTAAIPAAAVIIPEDANGQFQVLLESTTDGQTWEQAQPGAYGGSTVKRFFRTRIIRTN